MAGKIKSKEESLLDLLELVVLKILLVEKIEDFQLENVYNKQLIKNTLNSALKAIIPTAERDYALIFNAGEKDTLKVLTQYKKLIVFIRDLNVPQKEKLTEMIEAYNFDKEVMDATIHRIIKKHNK
jgi:hypothetical protein